MVHSHSIPVFGVRQARPSSQPARGALFCGDWFQSVLSGPCDVRMYSLKADREPLPEGPRYADIRCNVLKGIRERQSRRSSCYAPARRSLHPLISIQKLSLDRFLKQFNVETPRTGLPTERIVLSCPGGSSFLYWLSALVLHSSLA